MTSPPIIGPSLRSRVIDSILVQTGQVWRRKKDGKQVEIVWMTDWRGSLRIQLRKAGATNHKNTHWIDGWNLPLLYDLAEERPAADPTAPLGEPPRGPRNDDRDAGDAESHGRQR